MKIALPAVLVLFLVACGGDPPKTVQEAPTPSGPPATVDEVNGAKIAGKVTFSGTAPEMAELDMSANPTCARMHRTPARSEEVVVDGEGSLKNVFVWVKSGVAARKWATPSVPVVVDQTGCVYVPHVVGVMTGQMVEFRNSDNTNHNVHPVAQNNPIWNESQPLKGEPKLKSFAREEVMLRVKCNVHPWMRAWIGVVQHPFYAVTGSDGTFAIKGLPAGTYTIESWHEKFGTQTQQVTVAAKEARSVDFSYKN